MLITTQASVLFEVFHPDFGMNIKKLLSAVIGQSKENCAKALRHTFVFRQNETRFLKNRLNKAVRSSNSPHPFRAERGVGRMDDRL